MIDGLKPYPKYKDSGVPWLGEVPEHWEVVRNGRLFAERREVGFPELPVLEVSLRTGVRVRNADSVGRKQALGDLSAYKRAHAGDIAYNMMRMWQGAVGVAPVEGLVSPAYVVARPFAEVESRYYEYLFRTPAYMGEVNNYSRGIVADRNRLYWDEFKDVRSLLPPDDEQVLIVRFLRAMDHGIARYIRAKKKLIALLNEQKQVIIHNALTRGLDRHVRLKPSGVEWLGDVPVHWSVVPLRRMTRSRCDGPFGSGLKSLHYTDSGVRVVRLQNIGHGDFKDGSRAFISSEHCETLGDHSVLEGDVLIAGLGDERHPAGRACVVPNGIGPAIVKADCFRFRLDQQKLYADFAALQLTATAVIASAVLSRGSTRQRTNLETTADRRIAVPSLREQIAICEHVTKVTRPLAAGVQVAEAAIAAARELRTRVLGDVVTGKLDIREAAAHLPLDEPADEFVEIGDTDEALVDDAEADMEAVEVED